MKQQDFKVTFLTDIVLNKTSNTEGKIENLDFIPGSAFLGMAVSKLGYDFDTFHSGKVRFGEATPLLEGKASIRVPFCFFSPKLDFDKKKVQNNHYIDYSNQEVLDKQFKQIRSGYMTEDFRYFEVDYNYTQKSSHDKELRRSKDSSMFGYNAIKKGTTWKFSLKFEDKFDIDSVLGVFDDKEHFLGKSKMSQYGRVNIEKLGEIQTIEAPKIEENDIAYLYVNSSLSLFNENGMPTFVPSKGSLGLENGEIFWEHTQIRTKTFTPYISIRQGRDSSRLAIEKGSVIALKNVSQNDIKSLSSGVGGFLSEGYGEILINPDFLMKKESFELKKLEEDETLIKKIQGIKVDDKDINKNLIKFLQARKTKKESFKTLGQMVDDFVSKNGEKYHIKKSQWGNMRMMAQFIQDKTECKDEIEKFISHGSSKSQWKNVKDDFIEHLKGKETDYIKLLAMKMADVAKD